MSAGTGPLQDSIVALVKLVGSHQARRRTVDTDGNRGEPVKPVIAVFIESDLTGRGDFHGEPISGFVVGVGKALERGL